MFYSIASASVPVAPKMIIMTHERTMMTANTVQKVNRSFRMSAARMQAIRGVKLHTIPVMLTVKYFMALYEMKMLRVVWQDLKASAHLLSGSMVSYMMCLSLRFRHIRSSRMEMIAFIEVTWRT